ncbi:MAG: hypothetical protein SFY32_05970 [Bacteroidota bacterium]|nr:hypothetical protein [Bacteroidota bacterium]
MGIITVELKISNAYNTKIETVLVPAKVDSGATMLVLPESVVKEFGFPIIRKQSVKYANEKTELLDVVHGVIMEVCGRKGVFEAISQPNKNYALLGAVPMEVLDLIVEPSSLGLYPNPRSIDAPMAEIE